MTTLVAAGDPQALPWALDALERGALVAIPTDTVYGLAARLDRPAGLRRLYEAKGRPEDRAIPVLLSNADLISELTTGLPAGAEEFAGRFWPGPLTIVLPRGPRVPDLVTAGGDTVGLRMPDHPFALALIEAAGGALAVTSANRSGEPSLRDPAAEPGAALGADLDLLLHGGPTPGGVPSTVVALEADDLRVLREGAIPPDELAASWADLRAEHDLRDGFWPREDG